MTRVGWKDQQQQPARSLTVDAGEDGSSREDESISEISESDIRHHPSGNETSSAAGGSSTESSSESEKNGQRQLPKPSQSELVEETKKLRKEAEELKSKLVNEKLALLEKRLKLIDADKDEELNEKLQETSQNREAKLQGAQKRYMLRTKSVQVEYAATVEQVKEEHQVALSELELAQERKARLKGDAAGAGHHRGSLRRSRQIAGQEIPRHAEHHLPKEDIDEDLDAIAEGAGEAALPAKQRRKSSTSTMATNATGS